MIYIEDIKKELSAYEEPDKIFNFKRFHKTNKGDYAEDYVFLAVSIPNIRILAKKHFKLLTLKDIQGLISSVYHEYRLLALTTLTYKMKESNPQQQTEIFEFYLNNICYINGWDLVDLSAYNIIGKYVLDNPIKKEILYKLANSDDLWSQRIAIVSTYTFIKNNKFNDTLNISKVLINTKYDLICKAVGWMLREVGKRDFKTEYNFLIENYKIMPRTMLRYSIEKFPENLRQKFLKNKFEEINIL